MPDQVIDGVHESPQIGWKILIKDGAIQAVGPGISIPENTEIVSLEGMTVLPGFIDMHAHIYANKGVNKVQNEPGYLKLYLAGGVTTIFSPGEFEPEKTLEFKEKIKTGEMIGPQLLTAGPYYDHRFEIFRSTDGETNQAKTKALFEKWEDRIDGIKVYERLDESEIKFLAKKADSLKIPITAHLGSVTAGRAVELGIDGLEHGIIAMPEFYTTGTPMPQRACVVASVDMNSTKVNSLINTLIEHNIYLSPTTVTFQSFLPDFKPAPSNWQTYLSADNNFVKTLNRMKETFGNSDCWDEALKVQNQFLKKFHDGGGMLVTGTDPVGPVILPGFGLHREIKSLVEVGLSYMQAIKAATINGAKALGRDEHIGSIEKGKSANFVVVKGNPVDDISVIGNTVMVIKEGKIYNPKVLRDSAKGKIGTAKN